MSYVRYGPWTDGATPGVASAFLNPLETFLLSLNSAAYDSHVSSDGSGNVATSGSLAAGTGSGIYKIGGTMSAGATMHFQDTTGYEPLNAKSGGISIAPNNSSSPSVIFVGISLGVKRANGTKLMEAAANGNFLISGNTYYTTQGTFAFSAGGSFDAFDFAEIYRVDTVYEDGTVVCPQDTETPIPYQAGPGERVIPLLTRCTHDGCPLAHVVSHEPGFCAGMPNYPGMENYDTFAPLTHAVALVGRVFAMGQGDIKGRDFVCSDGMGSVRAVLPGESVMALGVAMAPARDGRVPIIVRPVFVTGGAR